MFACNWKIATDSPLDWLNPRICVTRLVASPLGGYFRIVPFIVLLACPICMPALTTIA